MLSPSRFQIDPPMPGNRGVTSTTVYCVARSRPLKHNASLSVASPAIEDARMFDQFRRTSGDADRDESGIGLGLYIVRSIVERHAGTVRLERTEQGRTRATVELPREAPA